MAVLLCHCIACCVAEHACNL
uniref:Uncharacterized protein n=1 Tax=Rhizophora mucronata TaxID=61149 RepID=A0A2P2PGT7_RHIMU